MTNELKQLFMDLASEKAAEKPPSPLRQLEEIFENSKTEPLTNQTVEREFVFPSANGIHITTVGVIDIPGRGDNSITIAKPPKLDTLETLKSGKEKFSLRIVGNQVKLTAKIETSDQDKGLTYAGYRLRIQPKVRPD